ncbi:hypothetical protein QWJ07_31875 [Frankia sp. RB7]|nr:hypothetical protein [Frankia sp. RB7]
MTDIALIIQGNLFSRDFLLDGIRRTPEWLALDDASIDKLKDDLAAIYRRLPLSRATSESQTEDELIWPVLERLGWSDWLRQQNLAVKGRDDVPDGLLFASAGAKAHANKFDETWRRYEHGLALVESKRWGVRWIGELAGAARRRRSPLPLPKCCGICDAQTMSREASFVGAC